MTVTGRKVLVADAGGADVLVTIAGTTAGPRVVLVDRAAEGVHIAPMRRLDALDVAEVTFDTVAVDGQRVLGDRNDERTAELARDVATLLAAAELLGVGQAALDMTARYARERTQFDRPIGAFQAVSHPLANTLMDLEIGRSLVLGACHALARGSERATALVSAAKAWTNSAAVTAAERGVQLHGGIGFTWEHDIHLYLRRARCLAATWGSTSAHLDRIAALVERWDKEQQQ